jgi:hypothetical protein
MAAILQYRQQINWTSPKEDYARIREMRKQNLIELAQNKGAVPALLRHYGNGRWASFISDWGMTYDPRETDATLRYRPFVLYKRQIEYVEWVFARYMARERGLCKKFRGAGMSWLNVAIAVTMWLTQEDSVITLGSQKSEKVDNGPGDPDSLFWKARKFIELLPQIFVPEGWEKASKTMVVANPVTGSTIRGEIGDQIGRGGRASIAFPDEFAELEHQELVESALAETADCVIYGSTVPTRGGVGSKFYELEHHLPESQVFVFQWTEDERKRLNPPLEPEQEPWFIKKKSEVSPTVFASQFLLDYSAATSNAFVPSTAVHAAFNYPKSQIQQSPDLPWRVGIDASGMGNDKTKIWCRRGRVSLPVITLEKLDGIQLAMIVERECEKLLQSGPIELIGIDQDGPGGSCADQLRYGRFGPAVRSVHTGTKLSDGKNYNLRAWLHQQAKEYLEEGGCHIPNSPVFMSQSTAIQFSYKAGLLLIESKDEYRSRFSSGRTRAEKASGKSPDEWDSFVLTFLPPKELIRAQSVLPAASYSWQPLDSVMGY